MHSEKRRTKVRRFLRKCEEIKKIWLKKQGNQPPAARRNLSGEPQRAIFILAFRYELAFGLLLMTRSGDVGSRLRMDRTTGQLLPEQTANCRPPHTAFRLWVLRHELPQLLFELLAIVAVHHDLNGLA